MRARDVGAFGLGVIVGAVGVEVSYLARDTAAIRREIREIVGGTRNPSPYGEGGQDTPGSLRPTSQRLERVRLHIEQAERVICAEYDNASCPFPKPCRADLHHEAARALLRDLEQIEAPS